MVDSPLVSSSSSLSSSAAHSSVHATTAAHHGQDTAGLDPLFRDHHQMLVSANLIYYLTLGTNTFLFIGILLGLILREVNKKTKFPYSPMVLSAGMVLGLLQ